MHLYHILTADSSPLRRTSFPTSHLTTWFQTLFFWLQDSHIFMSCHQQLTYTVHSKQSHGGVTFSESFNTPNVTVTGSMWEANGLWWKPLLHHNILIWLPCNRTGFWRVSLLQSNMSSGGLASRFKGRLSIGNLQGHTPWVFHWIPTSHVETNFIIQDHHISKLT